MSYSTDFKINVNKLNSDEALLILMEITHPFLSSTLRLVNDNKNFIFNSNEYVAMPFQVIRQSDVQGELPKVTLNVPNVGRSLVKWIDSSGGGSGAEISIILARRSAPTTIEEKITFGIESVSISTELVSFNLVIQNNLVKRSMRYIYDTKRAPGLF